MRNVKEYYGAKYQDVLKVVLSRYYNLKQNLNYSWEDEHCVSKIFLLIIF